MCVEWSKTTLLQATSGVCHWHHGPVCKNGGLKRIASTRVCVRDCVCACVHPLALVYHLEAGGSACGLSVLWLDHRVRLPAHLPQVRTVPVQTQAIGLSELQV